MPGVDPPFTLSTTAPPGWSVKYTGTCTPAGSGNGGRSTGIGVTPISVASVPSGLRSRTRAGTWTSSPGTSGVVTTMSRVVGDGIVMACSTSMTGIHTVYGSAVVFVATTSTAIMKRPYFVFRVLAEPASTTSVWRPAGTPVTRKRPVSSVVALLSPSRMETLSNGQPSTRSTCPASAVTPGAAWSAG